MYTMRPDCMASAFANCGLSAFGNGVMFGTMPTKKNVSLPKAPDSTDFQENERCVPTINAGPPKKKDKSMVGCGMVAGPASFNPTYAGAAIHSLTHIKKKEKKSLPGDALLDSILKGKRAGSMSGKGCGMTGRGYQFEGDWMGDNWMKESDNNRRELLGSGLEHLGKAGDFGPPDQFNLSQTGGSSKNGGSWIEPMKRSLMGTVVPALIHHKGIDDLDGRRKVGRGAGWAAHYDKYAKTFKAGAMGQAAQEKFCKQIATTVVDYVNAERRRHNAPEIDKQQRYRLGKALLAYVHARTHTDVSDEYFWDEVLPYVLEGKLVAWGHLKTGGSYRC
jgi:hypothetical protein